MSQPGEAPPTPKRCTVAVIGAGTAGLSLATRLREQGIEDVLVLEREGEAGGVPRHCGHYPFGWREFRRLLKGPDYARRLRKTAAQAGVRILTGTSVTALLPNGRLDILDESGPRTLQAERVALCTGTREATRAQRFLDGQRPQGVLPTGALQSLVYLQRQKPFLRPVILGTELVSLSAIMTCQHRGVRPAAILEERDRFTAPSWMRAFPWLHRIPVHVGVRDITIIGQQRVERVTFTSADGRAHDIDTDGVIVSGDFRPDAAVLRGSHLQIDAGSGGPIIDQYFRCSDPHYYATGNVLRPVETSGWCWQEARQTADCIAADLNHPRSDHPHDDHQQDGHKPGATTFGQLRFERCHPDLKLIVPQQLAPDADCLTNVGSQPVHKPASVSGMPQLQLRVTRPCRGQLTFRNGNHLLHTQRLSAVPEQRILVPVEALLRHRQSVSEASTGETASGIVVTVSVE